MKELIKKQISYYFLNDYTGDLQSYFKKENDLLNAIMKIVETNERENNSWFDMFNERHPDEVKEILEDI